MTHRRTQLRSAFVARLQATATSVQGRVFSGRLMPIEEPELPAIVVHTRDAEQVTDRSTSGWNGFEQRRSIVTIVGIIQIEGDFDAALDDLSAEIEAGLQSWVIPGFESGDAMLLDTSSEAEFDGSLTTGAVTLRYAVDYRTPYRACSDPYVDPAGPLERSGAYPGGQVTPGCPGGNTGAACPIVAAEITVHGTPMP